MYSPLVLARVGGIDTRLVVDTGSDVHLMVRPLADEIDLALNAGEEGIDSSGATMPSWSGGPVGVVIGSATLSLAEVVVIPAPPPFPGWGIGGILSPQHLFPQAWTVLDMVRDELLALDADDHAVRAWLRGRSPKLTPLEVQREDDRAVPVIRAGLPPDGESRFLIDSGARSTDVDASVLSDRVGGPVERLGTGVSGTAITGVASKGRVLAVGGTLVEIPSLGVRDGSHDPPGLIGMDALRGTVVALKASRHEPLLWQVP